MANRWFFRICVIFAIATCILSAAIAVGTRFDGHPDEAIHGDAFCYFQQNYLPPLLNTEGLRYSPDGTSRAYNGEIVYWLWGRIAAGIAPLTAFLTADALLPDGGVAQDATGVRSVLFLPFLANPFFCTYNVYVFRLFNTVLLGLTLSILLLAGRSHPWPRMFAALMVCVPQVTYVYSYANSDAWGLSMSLFLFTFAVMRPKPFASAGSTVVLGILTAMVILSKQPYWISLPFAYLWIALGSRPLRLDGWRGGINTPLVRRMVLFVLVVFVLVSPLRVFEPLRNADYARQVEQMREQRSWIGFKPSNITYASFRQAARGTPFTEVLRNPRWYESSLASLYGKFGYMIVALSTWQYLSVGALVLLFVALTYWFGVRRAWMLPDATRLALWVSPIFVGINLFASLYNSWTYDFQPQGRYLFPALLPLTLMLTCTIPYEPRWSRYLRAVAWLCACVLALWTLYYYVLANPVLAA